MKKIKINFFQIIEILDGFNSTFLAFVALSLKQQMRPSAALERATLLLSVDNNNLPTEFTEKSNDDFSITEIPPHHEEDYKKIKLSYHSKSGKEYIFLMVDEYPSARWRDKIHQIEFSESSSLLEFILQVSNTEGIHPNPLFRG